jgi:hypothetical protein
MATNVVEGTLICFVPFSPSAFLSREGFWKVGCTVGALEEVDCDNFGCGVFLFRGAFEDFDEMESVSLSPERSSKVLLV